MLSFVYDFKLTRWLPIVFLPLLEIQQH